jgi:hypothetical protein
MNIEAFSCTPVNREPASLIVLFYVSVSDHYLCITLGMRSDGRRSILRTQPSHATRQPNSRDLPRGCAQDSLKAMPG